MGFYLFIGFGKHSVIWLLNSIEINGNISLSDYGITFITAIIYVVIMGIIKGFDTLSDGDYDNAGLNLIFAVFGGIGCYGVYKFLENKGEKEKELTEKEGIESTSLMEEN